jgi:hypothetical protein
MALIYAETSTQEPWSSSTSTPTAGPPRWNARRRHRPRPHHPHRAPTARPAIVAIDEFSASPEQVARLFGRARSSGLSLLLGTQELADLQAPDHPTLLHQVLGNTANVIAHRQRVPDSAELIAQIAGTHGSWTHTRRTDDVGTPTETGTCT